MLLLLPALAQAQTLSWRTCKGPQAPCPFPLTTADRYLGSFAPGESFDLVVDSIVPSPLATQGVRSLHYFDETVLTQLTRCTRPPDSFGWPISPPESVDPTEFGRCDGVSLPAKPTAGGTAGICHLEPNWSLSVVSLANPACYDVGFGDGSTQIHNPPILPEVELTYEISAGAPNGLHELRVLRQELETFGGFVPSDPQGTQFLFYVPEPEMPVSLLAGMGLLAVLGRRK